MNRRLFGKALLAAPAIPAVAAIQSRPSAPAPFTGGSFSAQDWAKAFVDHVRHNPSIATDEATMMAWFASALMRGHDEGIRREKRDTEERLKALASLPVVMPENPLGSRSKYNRLMLKELARAYGSAF